MPSLREVVDDVDAALERFHPASSPAHQRRTMRAALAHRYFLHQHRLGEVEAFSRAVDVPGAGGDVTFVKPENRYGPANLEHYRRAVAGQPVRDTLATARDFLVAPPGMRPL